MATPDAVAAALCCMAIASLFVVFCNYLSPVQHSILTRFFYRHTVSQRDHPYYVTEDPLGIDQEELCFGTVMGGKGLAAVDNSGSTYGGALANAERVVNALECKDVTEQ